jgi:hypothetical protein
VIAPVDLHRMFCQGMPSFLAVGYRASRFVLDRPTKRVSLLVGTPQLCSRVSPERPANFRAK